MFERIRAEILHRRLVRRHKVTLQNPSFSFWLDSDASRPSQLRDLVISAAHIQTLRSSRLSVLKQTTDSLGLINCSVKPSQTWYLSFCGTLQKKMVEYSSHFINSALTVSQWQRIKSHQVLYTATETILLL